MSDGQFQKEGEQDPSLPSPSQQLLAHSCVSAPFSADASGLSCHCDAIYWSTIPSISHFRWLPSPLFLFSWREVNTQSLCVAPNRCQWHPWSILALRSIKEEPSCFTGKQREFTAVLCQPSPLRSLWSDSFHGLQVHVRNLFRMLWPWKLPIKVPLWCFHWLWASSAYALRSHPSPSASCTHRECCGWSANSNR